MVVLLLVLLKACSGGSSRTDAGSCLSDLLPNLPASIDSVAGIDYVAARHQGYADDGSLEDIGASISETGVVPDPVTVAYRIKPLADDERFEAQTGVAPHDIECAIGTEQAAVLSGSFTPSRVKGSDAGAAGRLAATDEVLAFTSGKPPAADLLEPATEDGLAGHEEVVEVLETLRDHDAYSLLVQRGDGTERNGRARAAGIGAAGSGDDRNVVVVWSFVDEDAANEGRPEVAEQINTVLRGTASVRNSDLTVDGNLIVADLPVRTAPDLSAIFDAGTRLVPEPAA